MRIKAILAAAGCLVLLIAVINSLYIVHEGEYKVVLKFGEAVRVAKSPGLNVKIPFIETVSAMPKREMVYDSKPTPILTRDKKPIVVDNYTVWRITEPYQFLRKVQNVKAAEDRIDAAVYSTVRRKLSGIEYSKIISENKDSSRTNLNDEITKEVYDMFVNDYGITIIDVRIKRTDLPEENKQSVYNRMVSDRQSIAASYLSEGDEESQKITAKADRTATELIAKAESQAKKIVAEGEQEAARIYNQAYGKSPQFYKLYRTLESYKTTLQGEPVIMLPIDSPYTKILLGK